MGAGRSFWWGVVALGGWAWACSRPVVPGSAADASVPPGDGGPGPVPAADAGTAPDAGGPQPGTPPAHGGGDLSRPPLELGGGCDVRLPAPGPIGGTAGTLPAPGPYRPCVLLGDQVIGALRLSADGSRVAALGTGGQVLVLAADTLAPIATLGRARGAYTAVALSRDGSLAAAGGERDGELDLWRVDDHALLLAVDLGPAPSLAGGQIALSSDARRIAATAGSDIAVVDVATAAVQRFPGVSGASTAALYFADADRKLAFVPFGHWSDGATGGSVALLDLPTGQVNTLLVHQDIYGPEQLAVSADGSTLLTTRYGDWVIWDAATGTKRAAVGQPATASFGVLGLDADGTNVGVIMSDAPVPGHTWFQRRRATDGAVVDEQPIDLRNVGNAMMIWSGAANRLMVPTSSPENGDRTIASVDLAAARVSARACSTAGVEGPIDFSQDGTRLLVASAGTLQVLDPSSGALVGPGSSVTDESSFSRAGLSPDGRHITWARFVDSGPTSSFYEVRLEDLASGTKQTLWQGQPGTDSPYQVFSPDSRLLASLDFSNATLAVFDVQSGQRLAQLWLDQPSFEPLGFVADDSAVRISNSSSVRTVRWRDGATLSEISLPIYPLAWSADGSTFVVQGTAHLDTFRDDVYLGTLPWTTDNDACFPTPEASMSPDGSLVSFGIDCGRPWNSTTGPLTEIIDATTGAVIQTIAIQPPVLFSWAGDRLATRDTVWCR